MRTSKICGWDDQEAFLDSLSKNDRARMFILMDDDRNKRIGIGGLMPIQWENRSAEISLILAPEDRGSNLGEISVETILSEGFYNMNLKLIYGECYTHNPYIRFWEKLAKKYLARTAILPFRKFWRDQYNDSFYFAIQKENFTAAIA